MAIDAGRPSGLGEAQTPADREVRPDVQAEKNTNCPSPRGDLSLNLTEIASRFKELEPSPASLPVIDQQRVEGVLRALVNGAYTIDAERIARKIIAFEQALDDKSS